MDENSTLSGALLLLYLSPGPDQLFCFLTAGDESFSLYAAKAVRFLLLHNKGPQTAVLNYIHLVSCNYVGEESGQAGLVSAQGVRSAVPAHNIIIGVESHRINRFHGLGHRILEGQF